MWRKKIKKKKWVLNQDLSKMVHSSIIKQAKIVATFISVGFTIYLIDVLRESDVMFNPSFALRDFILDSSNLRELDDAPGQVHHPQFKYILHGPSTCRNSQGGSIDYLIYVHTAPNNFARREAIRQSWGRPDALKGNTSKVIFFAGLPRGDQAEVTEIQKGLNEEARYIVVL